KTAKSNTKAIRNLLMSDINEIASSHLHYSNPKVTRIESHTRAGSYLLRELNKVYPKIEVPDQEDATLFRINGSGCRVRFTKKTLSQQWDKIPDVINRAIYPKFTGGPTWCNQSVIKAMNMVFGDFLVDDLSANNFCDFLSGVPSIEVDDRTVNLASR